MYLGSAATAAASNCLTFMLIDSSRIPKLATITAKLPDMAVVALNFDTLVEAVGGVHSVHGIHGIHGILPIGILCIYTPLFHTYITIILAHA